jgi:hypothetical protein
MHVSASYVGMREPEGIKILLTIHTLGVLQEAQSPPRVILFVTSGGRHNDHFPFLVQRKQTAARVKVSEVPHEHAIDTNLSLELLD